MSQDAAGAAAVATQSVGASSYGYETYRWLENIAEPRTAVPAASAPAVRVILFTDDESIKRCACCVSVPAPRRARRAAQPAAALTHARCDGQRSCPPPLMMMAAAHCHWAGTVMADGCGGEYNLQRARW